MVENIMSTFNHYFSALKYSPPKEKTVRNPL